MLTDIINNRPFTAIEVTAAMENVAYRPEFLGNFGERLFATRRVRTRTVAIYKREGRLAMVPTSPIGAPPVEWEPRGADIRDFRTRRLAKASTMYAEELQGVLAQPGQAAIGNLQQEIAARGAEIRNDLELTNENMRMGAIYGKVLDADGTTLDDWFANWGIAEPTPINMQLTNSATNVRQKVHQFARDYRRTAGGSFTVGTEIHAICGETFFDLLVTHANVEKTYLNYSAAAELRNDIGDTFNFGGIFWHDFRGTDDGTTMAVAANEARIFPVGGRDTFQRILGPAEFEPFINRPGQDVYAMLIPDRDRQAWLRTELYQYPLYICLRPELLAVMVSS